MKRNRVITALIALGFVLFPLVVKSDYYQHLVILALMWVVIGGSWNLLAGYTGQISFGHAIFFGTGAYTAGILANKLGISAWWGMAFGGIVAALFGIVIGWICFRLRGAYFALATIAAGEIFRLVATTWESLTDGMVGIMVLQTFRSKLPYYYIMLALLASGLLITRGVINSRVGYYLRALREAPEVAQSLGVNTARYRLIAIGLSAFLSALSGTFYAQYVLYIDPPSVISLGLSVEVVLISVFGGSGTLYGPLLGTAILIPLTNLIRAWLGGAGKGIAYMVFAGIIILICVLQPEGIIRLFKGPRKASRGYR